MDLAMGDYEFPTSCDKVGSLHRRFPSPSVIDGFETDTMLLVKIPFTDPEKYSFQIWSRFERLDFRITPRQDIDLKLAKFNLPPSDYLLRNHSVIKTDDLDQHLDYRDPKSYGFVIEIDRSELEGYYQLITSSPYVQDNYNASNLTWRWRDLPIDCNGDYNSVLYHFPESEFDVAGPVTLSEMRAIFRETYPTASPNIRLRVLVDNNTGEMGNVYLAENINSEEDEEDGRLRIGRTVLLNPEEYTVTDDARCFFCGMVLNPYPEMDLGDDFIEDDAAPDENSSSISFDIFGDPDRELYLDDLFGPDPE